LPLVPVGPSPHPRKFLGVFFSSRVLRESFVPLFSSRVKRVDSLYSLTRDPLKNLFIAASDLSLRPGLRVHRGIDRDIPRSLEFQTPLLPTDSGFLLKEQVPERSQFLVRESGARYPLPLALFPVSIFPPFFCFEDEIYLFPFFVPCEELPSPPVCTGPERVPLSPGDRTLFFLFEPSRTPSYSVTYLKRASSVCSVRDFFFRAFLPFLPAWLRPKIDASITKLLLFLVVSFF